MKNYWKGRVYLKIEKGSPWYSTGKGYDRCLKQLFRILGWSFALRVNNTQEFKDKYKEKLLKVFDKIEGDKAFKGQNIYYLYDCLWVLKHIDELETTDNWQVFYNKKDNSYIGYSHRAAQEFKIGDMLFTGKKPKNIHQFYCNKKLRWKMLKTLLKYHFKNDVFAFEDVFEDTIISHGIASFIPFRMCGEKVIETKEEAYQAACNFAKYVS